MVRDRYDACIPRPLRSYPKEPIETRLLRWFEKVTKNSEFMRSEEKPETQLHLPKGFAVDLELRSSAVTIVQEGDTVHLVSPEQERPLATLSVL